MVSAAIWDVTNQNVEAFHEEEQSNPDVQAAIIAQGQLMNDHLIICMNILNQTDGSENCDRTMLDIEKICIDHFHMFNECNDGRLNRYLNARDLD